VIIVTGDKDILQLVDENTKVYTPKKGLSNPVLYDKEKVEEELGISPSQVVDFKALVGDTSDNYPGVPGIGPKTALTLLRRFGSLKKIYQNLDKIDKKTAQRLKKGKKLAFLSRRLAQIKKDAPLTLNLQQCQFGDFDQEKVRRLFEKLEFKSLMEKLPEKKKEEQMRLI
jgi:DNA polymerase-1